MAKTTTTLASARLAIRAAAVAVAAPLLARLDLARLQRVLEPRRPAPAPADPRAAAEEIERVVGPVLRRGQPLVRPGCLVRGITRYAVLRRAGIDVVLCFGVGRPARDIEGHCWLVLGDDVVFEPPAATETFTCVVSISRAGVQQ